MKLLKILIAVIGILPIHLEAKAVQPSKDMVKGTYDHMNENLLLKKITDNSAGQSYDLRYVPHVDGKPIFIPVDEFETPSNMLKAKRSKLGYPLHLTKTPQLKSNIYLENKDDLKSSLIHSKKSDISILNTPFPIESNKYFKVDKLESNKYFKADKLESNKYLKDDKLESNKYLKTDIKQKEHADYPVVIDVITKSAISSENEIVGSLQEANEETYKINEFPGNAKNDLIGSKYENTIPNHIEKSLKEKPLKYEAAIESLNENIEDYEYPVLIRPHTATDKTKVINKSQFDSLKANEIKQILYTNDKLPEKRVTDSNLAIVKPAKFTKAPIKFLSYQQQGVTKMKHKYPNKIVKDTKSKDSVKSLDYDYHTFPNFQQPLDSDYNSEEYDTKQDYDSPVVVETFVKKNKDYDLPVVLEKLVKRVDKDYEHEIKISKEDKVDDFDTPVVVEALVKKADKDYEHETKNSKKDEVDYFDTPVVVEALVKKADKDYEHERKNEVDDFDTPVVVEALVKKADNDYDHETKISKKDEVDYFDTPIVVESFVKSGITKTASTKKNVPIVVETPTKKKLMKSKGKSSKSTIYSHYEDSSKLEDDSSKNKLQTVNKGKLDRNSGDLNLFSEEQNKDFLDNFREDGSGMIDQRSLFDAWPTSFHSQERKKFKKCTTPSKEPGNCMPIQMCQTPYLQLTLDDLLKKICTIDDAFIGICCPEFLAETLEVDWGNFQNNSINDKEAIQAKPEECGKLQEFGKNPQPWPWMAPLISVSTRRIFCGGVLVKDQYVLTAAHCTRKIPHNQIMVILATSEEDPQEFEVVEIKRHAQYNPRTMQNDIALLKLSKKVSARPSICLPDEDQEIGKEALLLSWSFAAGKEEKLLVLPSNECRKGFIRESIICTQSRVEDVMCNGDSGAPLIVNHNGKYQVIGILTWNRNDCDSSFPEIFTRVSYFRGWIENHSI